MFSCYTELNETPLPIFCLEPANVSNCLLLLEQRPEKTLADWQKASFCPCLVFHTRAKSLCARVTECVRVWEAVCTPLAKVEIMTESERQVSLGLKLAAPAALSCIFLWELGFEDSVVSFEVSLLSSPSCVRERLLETN